MYKAQILLVLGIWTLFLAYFGIQSDFKVILTALTGLALILLSYFVGKDYKKNHRGTEKVFDNFRENLDFEKKEGEKDVLL